VQFIDVGIKLDIKPVINSEGFITLKVKPEVSSVTSTLTTVSGSIIPIVATSQAETTVKVKDGTMILIGGLLKESKSKNTSGWPFLSRIPVINLLFGSSGKQNQKSELAIFLTPHIVRGDKSVGSAEFSPMPVEAGSSGTKKEVAAKELEKVAAARAQTDSSAGNKKQDTGADIADEASLKK
jgi:type II secretory pathway component GspD/PulD (secretin)